MKITLLGTGRMGAAIALRLMDQGHAVTVWNRTADKAAPLAAQGATLAATPAEAVRDSEAVLSILTDEAAIRYTYEGPQGALAAPVAGKLFIDMSTVRPETSRHLAELLRAQGAAFVECPVGGTVTPARDGKLLGLAGAAPEDFERAKPLLQQLCRRVEHVGEVGAGASLKLAINLPLLVYWQALGEAVALAAPAGLSPERLLDILADTSGAPGVLKLRTAAVASALNGADLGPAQFNIDSARKDLRTMVEEAQALGYTLPAASAALGIYNQASAAGLGDGDGTQLGAWWLKNAKGGAGA